jgi:hypothetical protein
MAMKKSLTKGKQISSKNFEKMDMASDKRKKIIEDSPLDLAIDKKMLAKIKSKK